MARLEKEANFLGINSEKPVRKKLEALPPETATVTVDYNKYWIEE